MDGHMGIKDVYYFNDNGSIIHIEMRKLTSNQSPICGPQPHWIGSILAVAVGRHTKQACFLSEKLFAAQSSVTNMTQGIDVLQLCYTIISACQRAAAACMQQPAFRPVFLLCGFKLVLCPPLCHPIDSRDADIQLGPCRHMRGPEAAGGSQPGLQEMSHLQGAHLGHPALRPHHE